MWAKCLGVSDGMVVMAGTIDRWELARYRRYGFTEPSGSVAFYDTIPLC